MENRQQYRPSPPITGATAAQESAGAADLRGKAGEAVASLKGAAQQAGSQMKEAAASVAADAGRQAKGFLNQRVGTSADFVRDVAQSARRAAAELEGNAPQLAGFVRSTAERAEEFSQQMRSKSVDELWRDASDFTRRQPALVFGLASLAGFCLLRILKATPAQTSRTNAWDRGPSQDPFATPPREPYGTTTASQFHGV